MSGEQSAGEPLRLWPWQRIWRWLLPPAWPGPRGDAWLGTLAAGDSGTASASTAAASAAAGGGGTFPLADLARDTLVAVLESLSAADLSRTAGASRLLFLLASEVQRRPTIVADVGAPAEVFASLRQQLVATPTLGFLFCTGSLKRSGVAEVLPKRLPPNCHVIGAETEELQALAPMRRPDQGRGTELRSVEQSGQLAVMLGSFPDAVAQSFHVKADADFFDAPNDEAMAAALRRHHLPVGPEWGTIVLIVGRGDFDPEAFLQGFQRCCPKAAIIGGIAGSRLLRHAHGRTVVYEAGIVGLALKGNVPLTALVSRGCSPLTPAMRARGAEVQVEEDEVADLAQLPERTLLVPELVGDDGASVSPLRTVVQAQREAQSKRNGRIFQLYAGVRFNPDGGYLLEHIGQNSFEQGGEMRLPLTDNQAVPPDCGVRFYGLDPEECEKDLRRLLGYVKQQCEEETLGSIMFTCGGRGRQFFGRDFVDAKTFQEAFPSLPLVGFWAGGEIGPQAVAEAAPEEATRTGRAALQGFTAVFGVFRAPPPARRTWLASLAEDQVPSAVGEVFDRLAGEATARAEAAAQEGDATGAELHRARAAALAAVPAAPAGVAAAA